MTTSISAKGAGFAAARPEQRRSPVARPDRHRVPEVIEATVVATDPGAPHTGHLSSSVQVEAALTQTVRLGAHPVRVAVAGGQLWFSLADLRDALGSEGIDVVIERLPARQRRVGITPDGGRVQLVSEGGVYALAILSDGVLGQSLQRWLHQRTRSRQPVDAVREGAPDKPWADFFVQVNALEAAAETLPLGGPRRSRPVRDEERQREHTARRR